MPMGLHQDQGAAGSNPARPCKWSVAQLDRAPEKRLVKTLSDLLLNFKFQISNLKCDGLNTEHFPQTPFECQ